MKQTIRKGVFETNSSSTHAIVIPHKVDEENYVSYDSLEHEYGFDREESRLVDHWDEKLAYVYMLLRYNKEISESTNFWKPEHSTTKEEIENFKERVIKIWNEMLFDETPSPRDLFNYIDRDGNDGDLTGEDEFHVICDRYGNFVDHANGLDNTDFLDRIKTDDDFLKRFLFNQDSYITIGGDEYRGYNIKTIGFEYDYKNKNEFNKKLKEYEKTHDVYFKGN